jgi:catalase
MPQNSGGRTWVDHTGVAADGWESDGEMVRGAYTLYPADDDFGQVGDLIRNVFDDEQLTRLVDTVTSALMARERSPVLERAFDYWKCIDTDIGRRIEGKVQSSRKF